ncbi:MAG: hypothetical protein V1716_05255 [Candidatus Uhrbacteria bacterium]
MSETINRYPGDAVRPSEILSVQKILEMIEHKGNKVLSETQVRKQKREIAEKLFVLKNSNKKKPLKELFLSLGLADWNLKDQSASSENERVLLQIQEARTNEEVVNIYLANFTKSELDSDRIYKACVERILQLNPSADSQQAVAILAKGFRGFVGEF